MADAHHHQQLIQDLVAAQGVAVIMGGPDTGKTTLARQILTDAASTGVAAAYVDADVAQSTIGPPTCAGLKWVHSPADLDSLHLADELRFVGSTDPSRLVLQMVIATATLVEKAREHADLIVVDTTGTVSGVIGETLKYHKIELTRPDHIVCIQRGSELEPIIGMLRRFFSADVITTSVHPELVPGSADEREFGRRQQLAAALSEPMEAWRVRPTVFAPTLPAGLDLTRLDRVLVGVQDGTGRCLGLGVLTHDEDVLRVLTNHGEGMQGLRLGSVRVDLSEHTTAPVNLRQVMFGVEI